MRGKELDAAVAAANPVDPAAGLAARHEGAATELRDAILVEPSSEGAWQRRNRAPASRLLAARRLLRRPAAAVIALLVSLALAAALFTSPGRAVTSWVGDRLGFGQPGEHPALQQLRHSWTKGTIAEGRPAHVLVVGPTPDGGRYEYITYWPKPRRTERGKLVQSEGPCFELDLTRLRNSYGLGCGILGEGPVISAAGVGGGGMPGHMLWHLAGQASIAVASLEVRLNGRPIETELVSVPSELVDRFHLGRHFQFFIAFMQGEERGGKLSVVARDVDGEVLARETFEAPGNFPIPGEPDQ